MAVTVTHSTVATLPDEAGKEVNKAEWNAPHTVTGLGSIATQAASAVAITGGTITGTAISGNTFTGGSGTLTLSTFTLTVSGDASITGINTGDQTSVTGNAGTATALQNARTIGGVSFNGTANITVLSATGGFTISGGDLVLGANNITMTGSLGATAARLTKGWFTDLQVTNAITGSITGNAATVTTNANLTGPITSAGNATAIAAQTGTGTTFVMQASPTITTAALGSSTATTQAPADNSTKLATTAYVDAAVLGQNYKEAAKYSSTAALPAIVYNNGASGVGATLIAVGLGALSLDGNTPAAADRVLIKNQVSTFQNGVYTVTTVGNAGVAFVLTRTTDFDQAGDIKTGDAIFVTSGTANATTTWAYTGGDNPVMGTDALTFAQSAGPGSYTQGNGITITGVSIAIDTSVTVDKTTAQTLTNKTLTSPTLTSPTVSSGPLTVSTTTNATDAATGSIVTAGGVGILKDAFVGGSFTAGGAASGSITGNGAVISLGSVFSLPSVSVAGAMLWVTASIPRMSLVEAAAAADNRVWNISASGAVLRISATGDAAGTGTAISITRSGSAIGVITFAGTSVVVNAPITGQSTATLGTAAGTTGALSFVGTTSGSVTLTAAAAAGSATFKLPTADGSSGQFMKTDGSGQLSFAAPASGGTTLLTMVASTSGTSIDFTVPSGVKVMNVMFDQVSMDATTPILIQLGDAGGIENTGYIAEYGQLATSTGSVGTSTAGFPLGVGTSTDSLCGRITLTLMDAATFLWTASGSLRAGTTKVSWVSGKKATSQEVTTVRITSTSGTASFDAGQINVSYSS